MIKTFTEETISRHAAICRMAGLCLSLCFSTLFFPTASLATTYVVDNNSNVDNVPDPFVPLDGTNSLARCIRIANLNAGADTIVFSNALGSPVTITLSGLAINQITDQLFIDGTSALGYLPGNPVVEIDGNLQNYSILDINGAGATNSVLKGLVLRNSGNWGLFIGNNANNVAIKGCFIGTNLAGTAASGNTYAGIEINNASNATIGGTSSADRNVLSGNLQSGIKISGTSTGNNIIGNYIGTDITGAIALGNTESGIYLTGIVGANIVGGIAAGNGNLISGNLQNGIHIDGEDNTTIKGNIIGMNTAGAAALGNTWSGIYMSNTSTGNTIGGLNATERNIISSNTANGVNIESSSTGNIVQGNYIGVNINGIGNFGNSQHGVMITSSNSNTIGGTVAGSGNVISNNAQSGIFTNTTSSSVIKGNIIGLDYTGTIDLGNVQNGISIIGGGTGAVIGGTTALERNIISGNTLSGVYFAGASNSNTIKGNYIGTAINGATAIPNSVNGIYFEGNSSSNTIGGITTNDRNIISGNTQSGIYFNASDNNLIQNNYIGVDVTGNAGLPNGRVLGSQNNHGIHLDNFSDNTSILDNVISGNGFAAGTLPSPYQNGAPENWTGTGNGIYMFASPGTIVKGNNIGVGADGTTILGNQENGIGIYSGSNSAIIGGSLTTERNIISNHKFHGIVVYASETCNIKGNFIGTDASATLDMGNQDAGIITIQVTSGTIGGTGANDGNTVVFAKDPTDGYGIRLQQSANVVVKGNFVGTNSGGVAQMGNIRNGIWSQNFGGFSNDANVIGASVTIPVAGEANIVAYNGMNGVAIENNGGTVSFNRIRGNSIYCNGSKGIALIGGTNEGIAIPVVTASSTTVISGTAGASGIVHVYRNNITGPGCGCEGEIYLGTANADGNGIWSFTYGAALTAAQVPTVTVTQTNLNSSTSEFTGLTVVTAEPEDSSICAGSDATFGVVASGLNLTYQWQVSTGGAFGNVVNGGVYSGATSDTLRISAATIGMTTYQYRVIVTGCTTQDTSLVADLTVNTLPAISSSPVDSTICAGANTIFVVAATGTNITYQWQENTGGGFANISNGGVYSGVTNDTLTITGATTGMTTYQYRAVVSGTCSPAATSAAAILTVNILPAISSSPAGSTICAGENTIFVAAATGTNLAYQWQENTGGGFANISNGGVYSGVTNDTLTITGATTGMTTYQYRAVVSGTCSPAATSAAAILTINTLPAISNSPVGSTICAGENTIFVAAATGTNLTYQWQENTGSGFANISNGGVYSGVTNDTLTITGATTGMTTYQYRAVVSGTCSPVATSAAAILTVNTLPAISSSPVDSTICAGANTIFVVAATGTNLTYQWQENTGGGFANISNSGVYNGVANDTLTITGATAGMTTYQYRVVVSGVCSPTSTSATATLTVNNSPFVTTSPGDMSTCEGSSATFGVSASGTGLLYQWQLSTDAGLSFNDINNGGVYSKATTDTLLITGATIGMNDYKYRVVVTGTCSPTDTSDIAILTINNVLSIISQPSDKKICPSTSTSFSSVASGSNLNYQWFVSTDGGAVFDTLFNTGVYTNATSSTLNITGATSSMSGYLYRLVASGSCEPLIVTTATSNVVSLAIDSLPVISSSPSDSTICAGANTIFTVSATGTNLTYQWQENTGSGFADISNGGVYSGVNNDTLTITGATAGMTTYQYRAVVSGTCSPAATSTAATLTVNTLPSISSSPSDSAICAGANTIFAVAATGTNLTYQWQENTGSGFTDISNGGVYSGVANDTLTITGATTGMTTYQYKVVVSGTCNPAAISAAAILTVDPINFGGAINKDAEVCTGNNTGVLKLIGNVGYVKRWEWSIDDFNTSNVIGNTTDSLTYTNLTKETKYRAVIQSGVCPEAYSNPATISINPATAGGAVPASVTVCSGNNSGALTLSGNTGTVVRWESSIDNFATVVTIPNTTISQSYNNLTVSTQYRAIVQSGVCSSLSSSAATVFLDSATVGGTVSGSASICSGNNTGSLVLFGYVGSIVRWESSADNFVTVNSIANTTPTQGYTNLTVPEQYRAVVKSGTCSAVLSTNAIMGIKEVGKISVGPDTMICTGNTILLTATSGFKKYEWQNGSTDKSFLVIRPGTYQVTATDSNGCTAKGSINVISCDTLFIPNVITTNGDIYNQYLVILGNRPNSSLQIFDRWGLLVYAKDPYDNTWDGNGLSEGIYYYLYKRSGDPKVYKGWVEIIK